MRMTIEIGDWFVINGRPEQVCAVHKNKVSYHVGGDKTKPMKWVFINAVTPLVIAPYVFDGNGFKCVMGHDVTIGGNFLGVCPDKYIYKDDTQYISVTRFDDRWNVIHIYHNGCQPTNSAMVRYAHELQHALKLFGIDKKIMI